MEEQYYIFDGESWIKYLDIFECLLTQIKTIISLIRNSYFLFTILCQNTPVIITQFLALKAIENLPKVPKF